MSPTEIIKTKINSLISHRGHFRLLIVLYICWIAIAGLLLWKPLPGATQEPDFMGTPRVVDCRETVLDYDSCASEENSIAAATAIAERVLVIFFAPLIVIFLVGCSGWAFLWVREGYAQDPSTGAGS
jgi:hypothetical protein